MKIVVDIPEGVYDLIKYDIQATSGFINAYYAIRNGTVIPNDAKILTKEAYSDLCLRASHECKTGKWIEKDGFDGDVYYDCSACGESWTTIEGTPWDNDMNYCPHCGAKMEGAEK